MSTDFSSRWVRAGVHTGIIQHNVAIIKDRIGAADVWAVVKANGYGHGAVQVTQAALEAGATGLCVAIVDEGVALRRAGITAPILLLSEQPPELSELIVGYLLTPTVATTKSVAALASVASQQQQTLKVHMKVDTGMHRVGASPREALSLARFISESENVELEGVYTHFAVADQPDHPANVQQLESFTSVLAQLKEMGIIPPLVHAANSAAALANSDARFNMVRLGIAMYGLLPGHGVEELCQGLIPALTLRARVSAVRWVEAGEGVSYGLKKPLQKGSLIATVPIGYADGVPRRLGETDVPVLINGAPHSFAGSVTMDQIMIDCGADTSITIGDEVVLIGKQGDHVVTADDWADALGTIGYEIVCGISPRVYRQYI